VMALRHWARGDSTRPRPATVSVPALPTLAIRPQRSLCVDPHGKGVGLAAQNLSRAP
jgi:hypothetical protein